MSIEAVQENLLAAQSAAVQSGEMQQAAGDGMVVLSELAAQALREVGRLSGRVAVMANQLKGNATQQAAALIELTSAVEGTVVASDGTEGLDNPIANLQASKTAAESVLDGTFTMVARLPEVVTRLDEVYEYLKAFVGDTRGLGTEIGKSAAGTAVASDGVTEYIKRL